MTDIYRLEALPPQLDPATTARLVQVEAATLGHYLHTGFVDTAIRPLIVGPRVAGAAVTVQISGPDSTLLYHAMDRVRPGDMLVIDRVGDHKQACWGGFMAAVARIRGLAGVIIDGAGGRPVVFIPDVMPTRWHCRPTTNLAYDVEPYTSMLSRAAMLERATDEHWTLVLDHEPGHPVFTVKHDPEKPGTHMLEEAAV